MLKISHIKTSPSPDYSLSIQFSYLSGIKVVRDLKDQEEDPQRLLLDGVSLPIFHNRSTQSEQRMHLGKLPLHEQQLQGKNATSRLKSVKLRVMKRRPSTSRK